VLTQSLYTLPYLVDSDVAALAGTGVTAVYIDCCDELTPAALLPVVPQLTELSTFSCGKLHGGAWATASSRLRWLSQCYCRADVSDANLAALRRAKHVALTKVVTDADVAAHLTQTQRLELFVDRAGFNGSGLAGCTRLKALVLRSGLVSPYVSMPDDPHTLPLLRDDALAGCAGSLTRLLLVGMDVGDAALSALPALTTACVRASVRLTDAAWAGSPALARLKLVECGAVTGAHLPPSLTALHVDRCARFTGAGLAGCPALCELSVEDCPAFARGVLAALPCLRQLRLDEFAEVREEGDPTVTDAQLARAPSLERLELFGCPSVTGEGLQPLAGRLWRLKLVLCEAVTGGSLGALVALEALVVSWCPAFRTLVALPRLRHLRLRGVSPALTDAELARAPSLERLELVKCAGVTGAGLQPLVRLRLLQVEECEAFTGGSLPALGELGVLTVKLCPAMQLGVLPACPRLWVVNIEDPRWTGIRGGPEQAAAEARAVLGPEWDVRVPRLHEYTWRAEHADWRTRARRSSSNSSSGAGGATAGAGGGATAGVGGGSGGGDASGPSPAQRARLGE
jgi:uncharacterized membrane protein YgcG